jgi:hypothetical protein
MKISRRDALKVAAAVPGRRAGVRGGGSTEEPRRAELGAGASGGQDGDVIAINVGIAANNQSNTLAQTVGFSVYASEAADISRLDDPQLANSWMEFSAPLIFY